MRILNFTKQGHSIKIALVFLVLVKKSAISSSSAATLTFRAR